jgi:NTE family protein
VLQERLQEWVAHGEKLQLIPHLPDHTRLLDFGKMEACMEAGYEETKRKMPEIKRLFSPSYPGSRRVFRTRP